jgi:tetratricopeptide (TPR) repeat protein
MFKKLKNIFNKSTSKQIKHLDTGETQEFSEGELIELYDADGQKVYIEREEFRTNVLPHNIQGSWDDPQELYNVILGNVVDFPLELEEAAKRQIEIDDFPERGHAIASIVFMKINKFLEARQILENYIEKYEPSAVILTNLAKTYEEPTKSEEILWSALQLDPNFNNGLDLWLAIRAEREGDETYHIDLLTLTRLPNSWRPQLYLAGEYLRSKKLEKALPLISHVLDTAPLESDAMAVISGDLGSNGFVQEILDIILPRYAHECGEARNVLQNILQAFYELRMANEGLAVIHKLKPPQLSSEPKEKLEQSLFMEFLNDYEKMFKKILTK